MQSAARAIATQGAPNLGFNPNQPAVRLPNVHNGLAVGGLRVAPGVPANLAAPAPGENPALWQGAQLPVQSTASSGRTDVRITQTAPQALLNWTTFNVGRETALAFDQSAGGANQTQWIAFNRVLDPSGVPSQILGSIQASGQVFVLNQNGILFGGTSQVNVHTLLAASLPLNDNLISRGLLNNPDYQFLLSQLPVPVLASGSVPAFNPPAPTTPTGRPGDVIVQAGAQLSSPSSADRVGGRITLVGPNVRNAGTISTPDGQTILAAGLQAGFVAHPSTDPTLRGLDVFIGATDANSGRVTNSGYIDAPRASVTLAGSTVEQLGVIRATTSVSLNGRIDLLANFGTVRTSVLGVPGFSPTQSGAVTLGPGSVTTVLPELDNTERVVGTQLALGSIVSMQGRSIYLAPQSLLLAPSASLPANAAQPARAQDGSNLEAGISLRTGAWTPFAGGRYQFTRSEGQIYLDAGAAIDAAGSFGVAASVTENIVAAELRGNELADSPIQRDGPLRGQTVFIDLRQTGTYDGRTWVGTPLADVSGFVGLVQRTVGELTISGGTVSLSAGSSVVMQPGSRVDVSGGTIDYAGGLVRTTRVTSGGRIFDISQATPDRIYDGIYNGFTESSPRYGLASTFTSSLTAGQQFQAGYTFGGDGGRLSVAAPAMALDGVMLGVTTSGPRQNVVPPRASSLALVFQGQDPAPPLFLPTAPAVPPSLVFQNESFLSPAAPFGLDAEGRPLALRLDRQIQGVLSPALVGPGGFGVVRVENPDGLIGIPAGTVVETVPGGSLTLLGANVDIQGTVRAPGGSLAFTATTISPADAARLSSTSGASAPAPNSTRGYFTLGSAAVLSTAGLVVDRRGLADAPTDVPFTITGGSVSIAAFDVNLRSGSVIDVSSGALVSSAGRVTNADAGAISIRGGQDPGLASVIGGRLALGATLTGYAGGAGGSLSLLAPRVVVSGDATFDPGALNLAPTFFNQGGFSRYMIAGLGAARVNAPDEFLPGVLIAPNTVISPSAENYLVNLDGSPITLSTILRPEALRTPVSLSFNATGVVDSFRGNIVTVRGDLVLGLNAAIQAEPRAAVSLAGDTVSIFGSVVAPGGTIAVRGASNSLPIFADQSGALVTVDLGPRSLLSTAGRVQLAPDPLGYRTGTVLPGGRITVAGNVAAEAGAVLDVSGAAGVLDLAPGAAGVSLPTEATALALVPTRLESNAGAITFTGGQALFVDATLIGRAGGPNAQGGALSISSSRFVPLNSDPSTPLDVNLVVTQSGRTIPAPFYIPGRTGVGNPVIARDGSALPGRGYFAADSFAGTGFDSLTLGGTIRFSGPVQLAASTSLSLAGGGVIFADAPVSLSAPYVRLGTAFQPPLTDLQRQQTVSAFTVAGAPFYFDPVHGDGTLAIAGRVIDVGNLSLQNIGVLRLDAGSGDIRGNGTLEAAGSIFLNAGRIYPPTGVSFTVNALDYVSEGARFSGAVGITGAGDASPLPLSAGGQLNIYGSFLSQAGVLRAPLGTINLGASLTGSAGRSLISNQPFAPSQNLLVAPGSVTSVAAVDPATGRGVVIPFGTNSNGVAWIDPAGTDITAIGPPPKAVNLSAASVSVQPGAVLDLAGGGDLYAYRFVPGTGGSRDVLAATGSFAVIPGYAAEFAPYAPGYGTAPAVGERVFLRGGGGLPEGFYTLLPARYALLPGAFLVTPRSGTPAEATAPLLDGAAVVSGYQFNSLRAGGQPVSGQAFASFEVAPAVTVRTRAQYEDTFANQFFADNAAAREVASSRLPRDAGQLVVAALRTLTLQGTLRATAAPNGLGGIVDIASPNEIFIARAGAAGPASALTLDAATLSAFGAESLVIGGFRRATPAGTAVTVLTSGITLDNAGSPLSGPDVTLVSNSRLTLAPGAELAATGALASPALGLLLGDETRLGSGDGTVARVSVDPAAAVTRAGVSAAPGPILAVGAGARITGASLTLDSTADATLGVGAVLRADTVSLASGRVSLVLGDAASPAAGAGLVLSGPALESIQANALSLGILSYSTLDLYGAGRIGALGADGRPTLASLTLRTGEIRGFANGGGTVGFAAREILLGNSTGLVGPGPVAGAAMSGALEFTAETLRLGFTQVDPARSGALRVDQFATLTLSASRLIRAEGSGGANAGLFAQGDVVLRAPLLTGADAAEQTISAGGSLRFLIIGTADAAVTGGLGATITLLGATVALDSAVLLPSGRLAVRATTGDVTVGGRLDAGGAVRTFNDLAYYTPGGQVELTSDRGVVRLAAGSVVSVAAPIGGGDAGTLVVRAPFGNFSSLGTLFGQGGAGGTFALDVGTSPALGTLNAQLDVAGFTLARAFRVRSGNAVLDGVATARTFDLSVDAGSLLVTGTVDASGARGGTISLAASGDLTLATGARLTVAAQALDAAGRAGSIFLGATTGRLDLAAGSVIELGAAGADAGTLHLRAPQIGAEVAITSLAGTVTRAGEVVVEGFSVQDANTPGAGSIDALQAEAFARATAFMAEAPATEARLLAANPSLAGRLHVRPGIEIVNSRGDLVLNEDWDLSTWRFGATRPVVDDAGRPLTGPGGVPLVVGVEPGILTLRASGDLVLLGSLTDGFGTGVPGDVPLDSSGNPARWRQELLPLFADGSSQRSWTLRLTAGADLSAVDFRRVQPLEALPAGAGSLRLGRDGGLNVSFNPGFDAQTEEVLAGHFQVIRTGTGNIDVNAGRDVQLLNPFATIYTAGARVPDPTLGGRFNLPILNAGGGQDNLGALQQNPIYRAQWSTGGGNVSVSAGADIVHLTRDLNGELIPDSQRALPTSWLYRRGFVDPATGRFGPARFGDVASTAWWVDFSNFFQGIGALGGGNVSLTAGRDVSNVDAVVPTNARMPGLDASGGAVAPNAAALIELGGGDLRVRAGRDLDGGIYYVERGQGTLVAGRDVKTNATRSPSLTTITGVEADTFDARTWLPTTLFVGRGSFDVRAGGDLLLGPVANVFLLPGGYSNTFWYKTYFSTYDASTAVRAASLTGDVTLRDRVTLPTVGVGGSTPTLLAWEQNVLLLQPNVDTVASYQPWLRLNESSVEPFATAVALRPPSFRAFAPGGDINLVGPATFAPAPRGALTLAAAGALNGLQPSGLTTVNGVPTVAWISSTLNLSDADPAAIPGLASPLAYQTVAGTSLGVAVQTGLDFLSSFDRLFQETGATRGAAAVLQVKQALHAPGPLHLDDPEPVRLYALAGDLSGFTLFSPKAARLTAGRDVTDVALYVQNTRPGDVSVVSAGRDVVAYNARAPLRAAATAAGNALNQGEIPIVGDLQISGPGTFEVLAGRNFDLGIGPINADGTGLGLTSIGNARNPALPFAGASLLAGAGLGPATDLSGSQLDFAAFTAQFLDPATAGDRAARYLPSVARRLGITAADPAGIFAEYSARPAEERRLAALDVFFLALRDAGRDRNNPDSPSFGTYAAGYAAIAALFPGDTWRGDVSLTARQITTASGGDIALLVPGGRVTVGFNVPGAQAADQGILTQAGGNISLFTRDSVIVGTSRIFTLRGGNIAIWSTLGDIAAGASSKTVSAAPPTRVLVDPQSADVQTDLAGLATGGGIGVLATVAGVPPGDVDLIAPSGTIDAGDAGIRVSGNLNIAALQVVNTGNIQVGGASAGTPVVAAPALGAITAAATTGAAATQAAAETTRQAPTPAPGQDLPSIINVEVVGYGGEGNSGGNDDEDERRRRAQQGPPAT